jgi:signal transduction histidine kinase
MMPERDADRSVRGVLAFAHDITERKRAEDILKCDKETIEQLVREKMEELVEARLELDKGKRLSDIGVLAATVAHELRNPLAAIGLAASNIRRKAPLPLLDKHLRNISKKVAESNQIINNLLFYSRIKSPQYEKVDLSDILEEVVEVAKSKYKKSLPIILDIGPLRKARAEADPLQMKEVFFNILDNACDAVSENPDGSIRVAAACNAEAVSIRVEDSGLGMQQEILDKIFEPFFTTKSKGTGLGLCICRQIVKLHGGEIAIESESGKGTAVTVTLPRAPATPGVLSVESENRRRTG